MLDGGSGARSLLVAGRFFLQKDRVFPAGFRPRRILCLKVGSLHLRTAVKLQLPFCSVIWVKRWDLLLLERGGLDIDIKIRRKWVEEADMDFVSCFLDLLPPIGVFLGSVLW